MPSASARATKMKEQRFNIRATTDEKSLVEEAARATRMTSSQFVLQAALRSAEEVLADKSRFVLSEEQWGRFTTLLDRPAREIGALKKASSKPSPFRAG
jgi:uncharacterized protein (DUF1778 family)